MQVVKSNGTKQEFNIEKIKTRIDRLSKGLDVDSKNLAETIFKKLYDGIKTSEIDEAVAKLCHERSIDNPDYNKLGGKILVARLHKNRPSFYGAMKLIQANSGIFNKDFMIAVEKYGKLLESAIDYSRDYKFGYVGFKIFSHNYLKKIKNEPVECPQHVFMREAIAVSDDNIEDIIKTYDYLSSFYYTHATPTIGNAGMHNQQLSSCFLPMIAGDDMESILDANKEFGMISKYSGGVGFPVTNIRSKNSILKKSGGISKGIVPMLKMYEATALYIDQGGRRPGAFSPYLEPWHADIEDFIDTSTKIGDPRTRTPDLYPAVYVNRLFMEKVKSGEKWSLFSPDKATELFEAYDDLFTKEFKFTKLYEQYEKDGMAEKQVDARSLWQKIVKSRIETGFPYLVNKDEVNSKCNQKNIGTVKSSNLCVSPDTLVLTKYGHVKIKDLSGKNIEIWNGYEWSTAIFFKTGDNQELIEIELSNGVKIECTRYHKFILEDGYRVNASDLMIGMKLAKFNLPYECEASEQDIDIPYTNGFFSGDGTFSRDVPVIALHDKKKQLIDILDISTSSRKETSAGVINVCLDKNKIRGKTFVPINSSTKNKVEWFAGLCDSDGSVAKNGDNESIQITSVNKEFLLNVKLMLQTIGVDSKVTKAFDEQVREMPTNKGDGSKALYKCQESWRILVSSYEMYKLLNKSFVTHRLKLEKRMPQRDASRFIKVVSIKETGKISDTYCGYEPKNNTLILNGVMTGNCVEITEVATPDETPNCNLASIPLASFVEDNKFNFVKFGEVVEHAIKTLDNVIDRNCYINEKCRKSNLRNRPLGLGSSGLADVFMILNIPYDSEEAIKLNKQIAECRYYHALKASMELAKVKGKYESFDGSPISKGIFQFDMWKITPSDKYDWSWLKNEIITHGLRNSLLIAQMPTATTSSIFEVFESCEAPTDNIVERTTSAGNFLFINKYMIKKLKEIGMWNEKISKVCRVNGGSIANIEEIPKEIREVFKTAYEVNTKTYIDMCYDRACYTCQSESFNNYYPNNNIGKVSNMLIYAYDKGLKSIGYYLRTPKRVEVGTSVETDKEVITCSLDNKEGCAACSA